MEFSCPKCEGKGTMITKLCGICHGTKISAAEDLLAITVPPGAADGFEIIEEEEGDELPDHRAGNLRFIVVTSEEGPFRRNGTSNLSINMELSLVEVISLPMRIYMFNVHIVGSNWFQSNNTAF